MTPAQQRGVDKRLVLGKSNGIDALVRRMNDAENRALPITLTLRQIGMVLTFIEAAKRIANLPTKPHAAGESLLVRGLRARLKRAYKQLALPSSTKEQP